MRFFDLLSLIFYNLGRRKGRVALTAIGVIIGTAAVVVLVSLGIGLQENATSQLYGINDLTIINVSPNYDMMMEVSVQGPGGGSSGGQQPQIKQITPDVLQEIRALPGVASVVARDWMQGGGFVRFGKLETWPNIQGVDVSDLSELGYKLQAGTLKLEHNQMVIGAPVQKNFMDPNWRPGMDPPGEVDLLNQQVKLILQKWDQEGNEIKKTIMVTVVGVIPENRSETDWSMYMPMSDLEAFNQWFMGKRPNRNKDGYPFVTVKAVDAKNVTDISEVINAMGYRAESPQDYVQGVNSFFTVLQIVFGGVGAVALLVAAIGIANTMTMAILERTREIGLMKAVGATNNNVLTVFLGEAAGIGFLGGLGGVLIGWSGGAVLNVVALSYFASQPSTGGMPPTTLAAVTPTWLPFFALGFATLVGLLSGLYPALRAATLVPVTALKYE